MNDRDDALRELFHALHAEDEARAPSYQRVMSRRSTARRRIGPLVWVAMLLLLVVWWKPYPPTEHPTEAVAPPSESLSNWHAPTDFLLRTPGRELLEELPSFGSSTPVIPSIDQSAKGVSS
ncbi:MAG TPA: hypothetical protein VHL58_05590 [Thermoanaerobaculia bacterium]|nr:hypothetical protein [Thermoanaerobaculia bacterium]